MKKYLTTAILKKSKQDDSKLWMCYGPVHASIEYGSKDDAMRQSADPDPVAMDLYLVQSFEHIQPEDMVIEHTGIGYLVYNCSKDWHTYPPEHQERCRKVIASSRELFETPVVDEAFIIERKNYLLGVGDHKVVVKESDDGTMTYHPYKELFDRSEVTQLLQKYADDNALLSDKQDIEAFNAWMEENF